MVQLALLLAQPNTIGVCLTLAWGAPRSSFGGARPSRGLCASLPCAQGPWGPRRLCLYRTRRLVSGCQIETCHESPSSPPCVSDPQRLVSTSTADLVHHNGDTAHSGILTPRHSPSILPGHPADRARARACHGYLERSLESSHNRGAQSRCA